MFNKAALKALEVLPFSPGTNGVIVANDWHTAILPVLVKVSHTDYGSWISVLPLSFETCKTPMSTSVSACFRALTQSTVSLASAHLKPITLKLCFYL